MDGQRTLLVSVLQARDLRAEGEECLAQVAVAVDVRGGEGWVHANGKRRTSAAAVGECGAAAAMWGKLAGESLVLVPSSHREALLSPPCALRVEVLTDAESETLGSHEILLEELSSGTDWSTVGWYRLRSAFGRLAGEVRLFIQWGTNPGRDGDRTQYKGATFCPSWRQWYLHATVLRGSNLTRPKLAGANPEGEPEPQQEPVPGSEADLNNSNAQDDSKPEPRHGPEPEPELPEDGERAGSSEDQATCASFYVEGYDAPLYSRRSATAEGDDEVEWGPDGDGLLLAAPFELPQPPPTLAVELWDATGGLNDTTKQVLISRGVCDVGLLLARWRAERRLGLEAWTADEWLELTDGHGEPAGKLLVRLIWQPVGEEGEEGEEEKEEHKLVRELKRELSQLSTDKILSRLKTERLVSAGGEDTAVVEQLISEAEQEAVKGDKSSEKKVRKLRRSMSDLLIQDKISRIIKVETAAEAQQRAFFVSILECAGLPSHEEVCVKILCAGEARETDAANGSSGNPVWRHGAGQTVAFIDIRQEAVASESRARANWAIARWAEQQIAESHRESADKASKIKRVFRDMDEDGSGALDRDEFRRTLTSMGVEMDDTSIEEVFQHIDRDCGGSIEEEEFVHWWLNKQRTKDVVGSNDLLSRFDSMGTMNDLVRQSWVQGEAVDEFQGGMHGALKALRTGTVLPTKVRVQVYSRSGQKGGGNALAQQLLGVVDINLDHPSQICLTEDKDSCFTGWFGLKTSVERAPGGVHWHGRRRFGARQEETVGKIRLAFRWQHPIVAGSGQPWQLDATVFEAVDLPKIAMLTDLNSVGSNSPYVRFTVESFDAQTFQRKTVGHATSTATRSGSQPKWGVGCGLAEKWNQIMGESVQFHLADAPPSLGIELWNNDPSGDALIGVHVMQMDSAAAITDTAKCWDTGMMWCDLQHPETRANAGKVRMRVRWGAKPGKPGDDLGTRVHHATQVVRLLQDQYAHGGSYLSKTVLYTPGDVTSLLWEANRRFNRHITLYRQVPKLELQMEGADEAIRKRVAFETTERWVEVMRDVLQASGDSASKSIWQKWIGSVQTTEIVTSQPPAAKPGVEVLLAAVQSKHDLSQILASDSNEPLWAVEAKVQAGSRTSLGTEAAAIRLQAAIRGRRARVRGAHELHQVRALQALVRGRKARTVVARRRRREQAMSAEEQLEASQRLFAEQLRKAKDMVAGMSNLLTDIHTVADENENSLRGTDGWAVFSKANEEAAEALMQKHRNELDMCILAMEMETLLGRYQANNLCRQEVVEETRIRIEAAKRAEALALEELRKQTASLVDQMDELVLKTGAIGKNGWRKRRHPMEDLLMQAQKVIDEATESKIVPQYALAEARKQRERVYQEEQERIKAEDEAQLAGEKCLEAAFGQTMRFLFSPPKHSSLADGLTAADRRRQSERNEAEARNRAGKTWRGSLNTNEVLRGGKKLGVFADEWRRGRPELERAPNRLLRSAPSTEFISASYENMIFKRYPEERGSRYQLELERKRQLEKKQLQKLEQKKTEAERIRLAKSRQVAMKRVEIAGGEWNGKICTVLEEKGDNFLVEMDGQKCTVPKNGRGGVVLTSVSDMVSEPEHESIETVGNVNNATERSCSESENDSTTVRERIDSANDPFRSLLPSKSNARHSERLAVHPLLGPLPPEEHSAQSPLRGPTPDMTTLRGASQDRLGFPLSASAGNEISAETDFLEGWVQFGVRSLRSGEPLPPLSGVNPSRLAALQREAQDVDASMWRQNLRESECTTGAIGSLSAQSLRTRTGQVLGQGAQGR